MTKRSFAGGVSPAARLALALALSASAPIPAAAAPQGAPPVVMGASADPSLAELTVRGRHFGTALPAVSLAGAKLQVLASDDSRILVRLPAGTAPGRYAIAVTRADGASATAQVTVRAAASPASATATRTAAAPLGAPVLDSATAEADMAAVTLRGRNLGTAMPAVSLGGKALRTLTFDGTTVVARLPAATKAGKYLLTVKRTDGASASLQATLGR